MSSFWLVAVLSALSLGALHVAAFDNSRSDNLAVYWGQNSYGATHSDTANFQKTLSTYCQDDSIDAFPIAFLNVFFGPGGVPSIDLSNICSSVDDPVFSGTNMPDCSFLASDIQFCQSKGKIVTISLGGATGAASFTSDDQASAFGDTIWNTFLGGSSSVRPFGGAVLDGIDLDIEGGSTVHFAAFVNRIRTLASGANKQYYVTAAPQCPFPDAYLSTVLNAVAFDAVYVQFYNNYCGLTSASNPNDWDFDLWDNWAKTQAVNKNVKIYIGAPASSTAAGSGYVDASTLANIALQTRSQYSSFGGVMLWDASQAYANNRFDAAIKNAIRQSGSGPSSSNPVTVPTSSHTTPATSPTTQPTTTSHSTTVSPTTTVSSGSCAGVSAWVANVAYNGGDTVIYNGHLWTAKWWSYGDTPGGAAGDWTDDGACTSFAAAVPTAHVAAKSAKIASIPTTAA
ncbi:Glycoside Hydrolase Family 18 / Carbohydrate-Binding Module Family 5 protein [Trametes cinnabarina]|uniref:chitinase n=1 Tax=Pycnoporus cinnabarinus TaxID=5643 RepID=A0A060SHY5_PYCCI|nr:Glycoside Hydrolase Family 18 / Carbohydrate-Binding Module Family 5 protein [Trametes cinnabarina]